MRVEKFTESTNYGYYNLDPLSGVIVYDLLGEVFFDKIKKHTIEIFSNSSTNTFLTHTTQFNFENKKISLAASNESKRYQHVMFDFTMDPLWYHQTVDTVNHFCNMKNLEISPLFHKFINTVKKIAPFSDEPNKWVCYRQHLNVMDTGASLSLHLDASSTHYNTPSPAEARTASATFYMYDHIEGKGGELWTYNGFVFKPKANSLIILTTGANAFHGVTANMNDFVRLAFTTRWAHVDDLFLPGHPDKCLYKVNV